MYPNKTFLSQTKENELGFVSFCYFFFPPFQLWLHQPSYLTWAYTNGPTYLPIATLVVYQPTNFECVNIARLVFHNEGLPSIDGIAIQLHFCVVDCSKRVIDNLRCNLYVIIAISWPFGVSKIHIQHHAILSHLWSFSMIIKEKMIITILHLFLHQLFKTKHALCWFFLLIHIGHKCNLNLPFKNFKIVVYFEKLNWCELPTCSMYEK